MDNSSNDLKKALDQERQIMRESRDIEESSKSERERLRELMKEGLL